MTAITIKGQEYKIKFSYNSFCDNDLIDKASDILNLLTKKDTVSDNEDENRVLLKKMFITTRELLFEGFKKLNPVESPTEVGNLLDDYFDEGTEEEPHGIHEVFALVVNELVGEGFFGEIVTKAVKEAERITKLKKNPKNR